MSSLPTAELAADPRVRRGFEAQLRDRRARTESGEEPLGWKVGFGAPATMEKLGTCAPLVGHLMRSGLVAPGASFDISGFVDPVLEPEVAAHIGPGGELVALGPAFELADLDPPPEDPEAILLANVYQRAVMLGPPTPRRSLDGVTARVVVNGEATEVGDPEAFPGPLAPAVRHVAELLDAFGERLAEGSVVITGSVVPPIRVRAGDEVDYHLEPLGRLSISVRG